MQKFAKNADSSFLTAVVYATRLDSKYSETGSRMICTGGLKLTLIPKVGIG